MKAEIRGRRGAWHVFYEDESGLPTRVPVYGRDGVLKDVIEAGAPTGKLVEGHHVSPTREEAEGYARYLGADEITFVAVRQRPPRKARTPKRLEL